MDYFTKLLLFLGQQYHFHNRKIIFVEELRQLFPEEEIVEALQEPLKQGWVTPIMDDHHFEITELAIGTVLSYWNKDTFRTGEVGGGAIKGNEADRRFTIAVMFDTPVKFAEKAQISYGGKDLLLTCIDGFYYDAKVHTTTEEEFHEAEEVINRYLSHLSYHYRIPISIKSTHAGSIDISNVTKRSEPRTGIYLTLPQLIALQQNQARAVAFYRQFRNFSQLRTTESRYYQIISLLKIIEGIKPSADSVQNKTDFISLIDKYLPVLPTELQKFAQVVEAKYSIKHGVTRSFSDILWEHYRNGVAHWRARGNFLDPDEPDDAIATTINIVEQIVIMVLAKEYKIPN